jgi:hypothetical protein
VPHTRGIRAQVLKISSALLVALSGAVAATPSAFAGSHVPQPSPNPPKVDNNKVSILLSSSTSTAFQAGAGNTGASSSDLPLCFYQWASTAKDMPGTTGWLENWYLGQIHSAPGRDDPQATAIMDQFMPPAVAHAADQGDWYEQACSEYTSSTSANWLAAHPFLAWVPKGTAPPAPTIPPIDIARYVLKSMILPPLGPALSPTPPAPSIVNLATWAWLPSPGRQELTGTLGGVNVDVDVVPVTMTLTTDAPGGSFAFTPSDTCTRHGTTVGVPYSPGATAECGITFRVPKAAGFTVTGAVVWSVSWTSNQGAGGTLPNTIPILGNTITVTQEVQSING